MRGKEPSVNNLEPILTLMLLNCGAGENLRVPRIARRSNQSILKEISPEYSLEGLTLKLQYFGHLMHKNGLIWKDPDAGKDWRQKEKRATKDKMVGWHHWFHGHELRKTLGDSGEDWEAWYATVHGVTKRQLSLGNWTATIGLEAQGILSPT